jgi:two-component system sensor histidine kinase YesM
LLSYPIPKLSLQPLVENAIYHGLELKKGKGSMCIRAFSDRNRVIISISDDGVGMIPEKLGEIQQILKRHKQSDQLGLANVLERIQIHYGEAYGLEIESILYGGTTVNLVLPLYNPNV